MAPIALNSGARCFIVPRTRKNRAYQYLEVNEVK
jgi:hypothetical protein